MSEYDSDGIVANYNVDRLISVQKHYQMVLSGDLDMDIFVEHAAYLLEPDEYENMMNMIGNANGTK